jgi:zinc transport system substrate-binding protein
MKRYTLCLLITLLALVSCGRRSPGSSGERVITVTIPPFAWFVEQIGGDDFRVNVLLPPGADHHIWEPLPAQINALSGSEAFIMNGQLGFEHAWMDRFTQVNPGMKVLDLSGNIQMIGAEGLKVGGDDSHVDGDDSEGDHDADHAGEGDHHADHAREGDHDADHTGEGHTEEDHAHSHGGPDPHYWMSPSAARIMAQDIRDFLADLNPASAEKYDSNLEFVNRKITEVDSLVRVALGSDPHRTVMIFHPALAYMGLDYGFEQVSFEDEGKSPSPARMKELIDLAREKEIKIIFIQAEYDVRNAQSLSRETGAELIVINPMNREWPEAVMEVARAIGQK